MPAFTSTTIAPTWIAVTYVNSWVDEGGVYGGSAYWKDALGIVHLRVAIKNGTPNSLVFTLPAGYRPAQAQTVIGVNSTGIALCTAWLATNGQFTMFTGNTTLNTFYFSFPAES
jgi:hypothetical protein